METRRPLSLKSRKYKERRVSVDPIRLKRMSEVANVCNNKFGDGSMLRLTDDFRDKVGAISTGSLNLDIATGVGGIPKGRIVEVFGAESAGKTTLTLHIIAEAQKAGGIGYFVDAEHALDPSYAEALGVNLEYCPISQPETAEEALSIVEEIALQSVSGDVIVIDSVAGLTPKAEIDGEMGDHHIALQARLMAKAIRKIKATLKTRDVPAVFINQLRDNIGVMFGAKESTPGGRALKFFSSMRIDVRRIGAIQVGNDNVGNRTRAKVVKNKVASPFKVAEFDIMFGKGISKIGEIVDLAAEMKIVEKSGSWYSYNEERIGQGRENAKIFLEEHLDIVQEIEDKILLGGTCGK